MNRLRRIAKAMMPQSLENRIRGRFPVGSLQFWSRAFSKRSYAQDGEDLLVHSLLGGSKTPGFYADVGAHHPARYSNTLLFYLKGWHGINIDALPGSMELFKRWRPLDINLEIGISETAGEAQYYMFNAPELNCFSEEVARSRCKVARFRIIEKRPVPTKPLRAIFSEHVVPGTGVDFLSVDVEGMDLEVLKSNDWKRWRPSLVLAEDLHLKSLSDIEATDLGRYMRSIGYLPCAKTRLTLCFAEESRLTVTDFGLKVQRA